MGAWQAPAENRIGEVWQPRVLDNQYMATPMQCLYIYGSVADGAWLPGYLDSARFESVDGISFFGVQDFEVWSGGLGNPREAANLKRSSVDTVSQGAYHFASGLGSLCVLCAAAPVSIEGLVRSRSKG